MTTPYEISFLDPVPWRSLCEEYMDSLDVRIKQYSFNIFYILLSIFIFN